MADDVADDMADRRAGGFTLIEVMVALVVLGLAFGAALHSLSGALDRLGRDRNAAEALLLARSTLARVGRDIALAPGDVDGTVGGFSWQVQATPYAAAATPGLGALLGYTVHVAVGWKERGQARQVGLTTIRLAIGRGAS
jgi:general secretion pathway protein I